jgi:hypothetical protein
MIGAVKRGSAHGILTGLGFGRDDVRRFVTMYDRDALIRWEGDDVVIKSTKIINNHREAFLVALSVVKPKLVVKFEDM